MSNQKIKRGKIEGKCLKSLEKFMKITGQKATFIESEIRANNPGCRFSAMTIYNWQKGKQKINIASIDLIAEHMKKNGYEMEL